MQKTGDHTFVANMTVVVPCDMLEAEKMISALFASPVLHISASVEMTHWCTRRILTEIGQFS
jgi:hypothetical protein